MQVFKWELFLSNIAEQPLKGIELQDNTKKKGF